MSIPRSVGPLPALDIFTSSLNPRPQELVGIASACGYLAESVSCSQDASSSDEPIHPEMLDRGMDRALRNGYAATADVRPEVEYPLHGVLTVQGRAIDPRGEAQVNASQESNASGSSPVLGIWRVEAGALLPARADRVVPLAMARLVGADRVRFSATVEAGFGVAPTPRPRDDEFAAGMALDARLRATLLACGVSEVSVRRAGSLAVGSLGDELIDLEVGSRDRSGAVADVSGYWLGAAISALGFRNVPLGILPDCPGRLGEVIHQSARRGCQGIVFTAGLGLGYTDRLVEALRRAQARILLDEVDVNGGLGLLLAKTGGMDIVGLCGHPLWTSALFDLYVSPALRAQLGAPRSDWDWRLLHCPPELKASSRERSDEWLLEPVLRRLDASGRPIWEAVKNASCGLPALPEQVGWCLRGPSESAVTYYCPSPTKASR